MCGCTEILISFSGSNYFNTRKEISYLQQPCTISNKFKQFCRCFPEKCPTVFRAFTVVVKKSCEPFRSAKNSNFQFGNCALRYLFMSRVSGNSSKCFWIRGKKFSVSCPESHIFKKNDKTFQSKKHVSTATSVIFS